MSQQGYLAWFTNSDKVDPVELLKKLPRILGFERADFVSRHSIVSNLDEPDWGFDEISECYTAAELHRLYVPGKVLHINADFAKLGERIEHAVLEHIPAEVRGDFLPNRAYMTIGQHFWSDTEFEEIQTPYRVMVGCWGYSTPADGDEFKNRVVNLREVLDEKDKLEEVMGPVQVACYFNF